MGERAGRWLRADPRIRRRRRNQALGSQVFLLRLPAKKVTFEDYDPGWLVELARSQGYEPEVIEVLAACTRGYVRSADYVYFVDNQRATATRYLNVPKRD